MVSATSFVILDFKSFVPIYKQICSRALLIVVFINYRISCVVAPRKVFMITLWLVSLPI